MKVRCECGERGQLLNGPSPSAHPRLPIGQLLNGPSPSVARWQKFRPKSSKGAAEKKSWPKEFVAEFWLILPKSGRKGAAENWCFWKLAELFPKLAKLFRCTGRKFFWDLSTLRPPPTHASPLVTYLTVPRPPPTPAPPLVGEPIVEGYNVKTHNFYEIKVDF